MSMTIASAERMDRRAFAKRMTGAAVASMLLGQDAPAEKHTSTDASSVPFNFSVMLWTVYRDLPFEQRLEKVAEAGYRAVELVDEFKKWSAGDFREANARKRSLGIAFDATAGVKHGLADPRARDAFLVDLKKLVPIATELECPGIIVLSGDVVPGLSKPEQHESCVEGLKRAADVVSRSGITILLENIDPEENPRYYLTSAAEGFEIVRRVDNPQVKFLYDFYHEQIAEGNLIKKLEKDVGLIGLVHVADVPGRHAPGTGEINYSNIFRKLAELKYNGYVAMEFIPKADAVVELKEARELALRSVDRHG